MSATLIEKIMSLYQIKGLELSREDLLELIKNMGFDFVKHESDIESTYCKDIKLLGSFVFKCEYWVCIKVR